MGMPQSDIIRILAIVALFVNSTATGSPSYTFWLPGPGQPSDYYDTANWSNGLPGTGYDEDYYLEPIAVINNGGTALYTQNRNLRGQLYIDNGSVLRVEPGARIVSHENPDEIHGDNIIITNGSSLEIDSAEAELSSVTVDNSTLSIHDTASFTLQSTADVNLINGNVVIENTDTWMLGTFNGSGNITITDTSADWLYVSSGVINVDMHGNNTLGNRDCVIYGSVTIYPDGLSTFGSLLYGRLIMMPQSEIRADIDPLGDIEAIGPATIRYTGGTLYAMNGDTHNITMIFEGDTDIDLSTDMIFDRIELGTAVSSIQFDLGPSYPGIEYEKNHLTARTASIEAGSTVDLAGGTITISDELRADGQTFIASPGEPIYLTADDLSSVTDTIGGGQIIILPEPTCLGLLLAGVPIVLKRMTK